MIKRRYWCRTTLLILGLGGIFICIPVGAMVNPSAGYCTALGYRYEVIHTDIGDTGYCILPSGEQVDAWQFLLGQAGTKYSKYTYCAQEGYELKIINDPQRCQRFLTDSCSACVLSNGTDVEVTQLMGLTFQETTCGDGTCGMPENFISCPKDCPSGSFDEYCDRQSDGQCDPDCQAGDDVDCRSVVQNVTTVPPTTTRTASLSVLPLFGALGIAIILFMIRWRKQS